jgi:hypothetical protein
MFIEMFIFVHNINIFKMVVPKKFNEWKTGVIFRPGVKIRAYHMYRDFVDSCNGSFKRLSKKIFYEWLRNDFDGLSEGSDARGLWFMIGDESEKTDGQISKQQFRKLTSDKFVDWFDNRYESLLYLTYHSSELRSEFLNNYGVSEYLITKQRFNKWVEYGVNYKGCEIKKGRDTKGIFIVIS